LQCHLDNTGYRWLLFYLKIDSNIYTDDIICNVNGSIIFLNYI
jgi:hypothetical protein